MMPMRLLIALLLGLPCAASAQYYPPPDANQDGWYDYRVAPAYPGRRPSPYSYPAVPHYDPEPAQQQPDARCDADFRVYRESIDCFNRFRLHNGSVRPEAYSYCGSPVMDPSPRCGPPRNW
jgi:hypothetical protein